jgi:hypothetical protein
MLLVPSARVGDILRVPYRGAVATNGLPSYLTLTRGAHKKPADHQKGIFFFEQFQELGQAFDRFPAFIFYSNPYKRGAELTPWVDIIEPDEGYCLFHGDNRTPSGTPVSSRGNAKFIQSLRLFADPELRKFAPPVLVFQQVEFNGSRKGYRRFCGYGVPVRYALATQKTNRHGYFTNLVVELALFRLDTENEVFSWSWIDARRSRTVDADAALRLAPRAWRDWVRRGDLAIDTCRRFVARQSVVSTAEQSVTNPDERNILLDVLHYHRQRKHEFEGLASFVAQRILGPRCTRGWITKRSGDGGIDFICRVDVGDPADRLSRTSAVVLGQAKCVSPDAEIGGHALARVVARLQRGWIGVFVTTGMFSRQAQLELAQDKYPVVLINGRRLARVLLEVITQERISLADLLDRESAWYVEHSINLHPSRILGDAFSFLSATPASLSDITSNG